MKPIKLALIGCGFIGRRHLENIATMDAVSVEALVDLRPEAAEVFQQEFEIGGYTTTETERVFADKDIDGVMICTHHDSHTRLSVAAAAAGKDILLEKPMALTAEECREIAHAAEKAGVILAIDYKFRFAPTIMKAKELIHTPIVTVGQLVSEITADHSWTNDPVMGGGLILGHACHLLDTVYWLNESEPVSVYTISSPPEPGDPTEVQAAVATLRFENGAVASLTMSEAGENQYMSKWFVEVFDGERTAVFHHHFQQAEISGAEPAHIEVTRDPHSIGTKTFMEDFIHCLRTGDQPKIGAKDGIRATLMANRIMASVRSGRPERIDLDLYLS